ncbi:MAG TPA: hypothetical protein VM325_02400 [Alphaproteobacteria bacterium]|nr:hypothetical protein [Alphaproteobacteria bacterium]
MTDQVPALADYRYLARLYEHWVERFDGSPIPSWSNFDAVELRPWLGRLNLVAVERMHNANTGAGPNANIDADGGRRFVYRVFATDVAQALDHEMTGREVGADAPAVRDALIGDYAEVVDRGHPILRRHETSHRSRVLPHVRLMLPLGDGGAQVTRVLVGIHPLWRPVRTPLMSGLPPEIDPDVIFGAVRLQAGA